MTPETVNLKVFASLHEESREPWIWVPNNIGVKSGNVVRVLCTSTQKKIWCICRILDNNFVREYNRNDTFGIKNENDSVVVISKHYRDKLGIQNTGNKYEFKISRSLPIWGTVRTILDHPDPCYRFLFWLAVISITITIAFGLAGLIMGNRECTEKMMDKQIYPVHRDAIIKEKDFNGL
ncbi:MAG: hypothetical protein ABR969_04590 [Sedimentisphaerales bacterium]